MLLAADCAFTQVQAGRLAWTIDPTGHVRQSSDQPEPVVGRLSPAERSKRMRAHIESWLAANGQRLTVRQKELVQDMIDLVSPKFYELPPDPEVVGRKRVLTARVKCVFSNDDAMRAFTARTGAGSPRTTVRGIVEAVAEEWERLSNCAYGYVLNAR